MNSLPTSNASTRPIRSRFASLHFYLRVFASIGARLVGPTLALNFLASVAHAQSNYATPYFFTTLAGTAGTTGSADGGPSTARFSFPYGVAVDRLLNVYVADAGNH